MTIRYLEDPNKAPGDIQDKRSVSRIDIKHVHALNERTKELECLYQVINILGKAEHASFERGFQMVVDLVPGGMQFPRVACARLLIGDQEYRSERYVHSRWVVDEEVRIDRENAGTLEVAYTEMHPDSFRGPFLAEEVYLLKAIASLIGQVLHRRRLIEERNEQFQHVKRTYEKVLSGFIPICASCKSIKDENGTWHDLEAYVQKRTDATFSHGVCPKCVEKLYPYLDD